MSQENQTAQQQEFPLRHRILGRMPSMYVHNLVIQPLPESIVISFFETILPPKVELKQEDLDQLKEVGLLSECVARITMSQMAFLDAADAMYRVATNIRAAAEKQENGNAKL